MPGGDGQQLCPRRPAKGRKVYGVFVQLPGPDGIRQRPGQGAQGRPDGIQPGRPVERQRAGAALTAQRLQQPRQAEDVVAVVMGQADGVHLHQVDSGPAGGSLGPLAAVEQEAVSSAFGYRRREGAVGQGHGGRCTQQCNGQHKVSPYHKKSRWL